MTPVFPTPDHYLYHLQAMTSPEAKRLWRKAIKQKFNCTCVYCGTHYEQSQLTLDHVKPRAMGGQDISSNVVAACRRCNQDKGTKNWLTYMRETFGFQPDREQLILSHIQ